MESADLETAVSTAVKARMLNNGQSCIAAKRFIVAESIRDRFQAELLQQFQALKIGDPMEDSTDLGPLATSSIRDELDSQVKNAVNQGAKILDWGNGN